MPELKFEKGRIYAEEEGKLLAEILFPEKDGVADIKRTFVDDSLRGSGIAGELVKEAVAVIRSSGLKARATCVYAGAWFEKHPDQQDILE